MARNFRPEAISLSSQRSLLFNSSGHSRYCPQQFLLIWLVVELPVREILIPATGAAALGHQLLEEDCEISVKGPGGRK